MRRKRVLEITTNIGCRLRCTYCPQVELTSAYRSIQRPLKQPRVLTLEAFKHFLSTVPAEVDVHFSGFAEPWHAPDCVDMICFAYDKGHRIAVFTTADGVTESDIDRLTKISFKRFVVHLVDEFGEMKMEVGDAEIGILKSLKSRIAGLEFLTLGIPSKKLAEHLGSQPATRRIHSRAGNIELSGHTVGAAFSKETIEERNRGSTLVCREDRMLSNVLLPNGDVQFCSMDYGLKHSVGSLATQTYDEIVGGTAFRAIFEALSKADSAILCRSCEYAFPGRYHERSK